MTRDFWKGKTVFVTGHTGFKGAWLAAWLGRLGAEVTGLALPPETTPNLFDCLRLKHQLHHLEGDIRDAAVVDWAIKCAKAEIVFHLAAQPLVRPPTRSSKDLRDQRNGYRHVLEAIRATPVGPKGDRGDQRQVLREPGVGLGVSGERPNGRLGIPISSTKGCAELVIPAYRRFLSEWSSRRC